MASRLDHLEAAPAHPPRYVAETSADGLLQALLGEIRARTDFGRLVALSGADGRLLGLGAGVVEDEVDAFVRSVAQSEWRHADGWSAGPLAGDGSPLRALGSLRRAAVVREVAPGEDAFLAVVVETMPDDPRLAAVGEALREAAPLVFRAAELHALRLEVRTLEAQKLRSDTALDALPDPVLVVDGEFRILLANRRAEELLVTSQQDSRGRRHAVETNNLFFSAFRARAILERDRSAAHRELLLVDPTDGSDLLFEVSVRQAREDEGRREGAVFVLRDITDLKQATHELEVQFRRSVAAEHRARHQSERLNVIIDNAGVPIFVTDRQTNVMLANREAERLLEVGVASDERPGRSRDIRANDTRLAGFINEFLLQQPGRREGRLTLVDPDDGHEFPALAVSTKILNDRHEPTAVVTVLRDLTQEVENQHLAEELRVLNAELELRVAAATRELAERNVQLETQSAELERASRMKSEFLATMSHELRTPINAVIGYNTLLAEGLFGEISEGQRDGLERMRRAAEHLLSLINDILDLSRVEAGRVQVSATDVDLRSFLEKLTESVRPLAAQKSLAYVLDVDPDVPGLRTDRTRLRQVLLNLLSNALKFTDSGSVTLRAGATEDGEHVLLEVIDTGIGIAEENLESIFDAFSQVDQSATREYGGTGLGLAISRKLIRVMGGTLSVTSRVGSGSTFRVELPPEPPDSWDEEDGWDDAGEDADS